MGGRREAGGPATPFLLLFTLLLVSPAYVSGAYMITTPNEWLSPGTTKVCVYAVNASSTDKITLSLAEFTGSSFESEIKKELVRQVIELPEGKSEKCYDLTVPLSDDYNAKLLVKGTVGGVAVDEDRTVRLGKLYDRTFIQTDKYIYSPGEKVQFRVLTITGRDLQVARDEYPEIWVTTPSDNRIAQWKNVSNTDGVLHLDFQLADEPEEGTYAIMVKSNRTTERRTFKVEEYVLPRFEVTIQPPPYILATDDSFTFKVCANYTFGQQVKGNLTYRIDNKGSGRCRQRITQTIPINGCVDVVVTAEEMKMFDCRVSNVETTAVVEEEGTGVQLRSKEVTYVNNVAVSFKHLYKDNLMKPNLPYTIKVRAEQPDGTPAANVPVEVCAASSCNNVTTPEDGILTMLLPEYDSNGLDMSSLNCRSRLDSSRYIDSIEHYYSPSNSSLLIVAPEGKLECSPAAPRQHRLPVLFSARDQPTAAITVQVISRGNIQNMITQEVTLTGGELPIDPATLLSPMPPPIEGTVRGVVNLDIELPPTASPTARVLIWYTRADGEVVSDVRELEVEPCLAYNVTLDWSTQRAQPGEAASLTLSSEPNSVCSLGVVDRSTELLAQDPDPITPKKLFDYLNQFRLYTTNEDRSDNEYCQEKYPSATEGDLDIVPVPFLYGGWYSNYVDALRMFRDAGLYVITDLTVETRPCEKYGEFGGLGGSVGGIGSGFVADGGLLGSPPESPPAPQAISFESAEKVDPTGATLDAPRTNFVETWLWDIVVMPASGTQEQQVTLPDTITQWVGKAVCVHGEAGVGLSDRQSITTFTPFFVDLTLPPSVKRGELLPVTMSIFSYHNEPLPVKVTLEDSPEYEIVDTEATPGQLGNRNACIPPNDKVVLTVMIRPTVIGDVNLTVSAAVDSAAVEGCGAGANSPQKTDALIRPIKVEAEGFLREKTWTNYLCSDTDFQAGQNALTLDSVNLTLPEPMVEGSERGYVNVVGNLLALSIENLGHLIRMPYGCGEQNLINFAPNIYILRYLDATKQATTETRDKLLRYMNTGYQRQLLYRRYDGSFSSFGNADESPSTWLTAFVFKSFAQAGKDYIQVDEQKLNETKNWLLREQDADGCFISLGKALQKGMQGSPTSSRTPASLTAYVLAALGEAGEDPLSKPLDRAAQCLINDQSTHPYTLATKAYALALIKRPEAVNYVTSLLEAATEGKDTIYWTLPESLGNSKAIAMETAGYATLALVTLDPVKYIPQARKVVKWITEHRNSLGGFYTTQDTIVVLQALAAFESNKHQGPLSVTASVTAENLQHSFSVTDDNKLLHQQVTLPTLPTTVTLSMEGKGCAVLQTVLRYNIPTAEPSDAFDLTVNTNTAPDKRCVTKRITACASYRLPDEVSNMVVIEVDLISGYIPKKEDLKRLISDDKNLKRYEVDGSKVMFYVNELRANDTCVNFHVTREVDVMDAKPGTVLVYDYYQPEFYVSKRYMLPPKEECR